MCVCVYILSDTKSMPVSYSIEPKTNFRLLSQIEKQYVNQNDDYYGMFVCTKALTA